METVKGIFTEDDIFLHELQSTMDPHAQAALAPTMMGVEQTLWRLPAKARQDFLVGLMASTKAIYNRTETQ